MRSTFVAGCIATMFALSAGVALAQTAGYDGEMSRGHNLDLGPSAESYTATAPNEGTIAPAPQPAPAQTAATPGTGKVVEVPSYFYKAQGVEGQ